MKSWALWLCVGVISLVGAVLALLNPLSALVTASTLAGLTLLAIGLLQAWAALKANTKKERLSPGIAAAIALFMAALLLFGPFGNGSFLRFALAALLIASGAAKLWSARQMRGDELFRIVIGSGVVSILLGLVVFSGIPAFLAHSIGTVLGLELLANGATLTALALKHRKAARRKKRT